jgi:hypothetical protein
MPKYRSMIHEDALFLRDTAGTTAVADTARTVAAALAHYDVPHLIAGGLAVQKHGYPRMTVDVDIVVPDVLEAAEFGTADLSGSLARVRDVKDRLRDEQTGVAIKLLPSGKVVKAGCKVPFPQPRLASDKLQFVTLEELISLKLDSWANSPLRRICDKTDVIELILRRNLRRALPVAAPVRGCYFEVWDGLQAEP